MDVNKQQEFTFNKSRYSEWVIQNSLYWLSAYYRWSLSEDETCWIIRVKEDNEDIEFEINKLLNDYLLREKMMQKTGHLRDSIVIGVLKALQNRVEK